MSSPMTTDQARGRSAAIAPEATVGTVRLTVSDLARSRAFYEQVLGLRAAELESGALSLSAGADGFPLVELHADASAPALDRRATGLYHLALLFPSRRDLAFALGRVAQARWPLDGASDHLVSEALYLSDPDGNGIELYRDRPRSEWRYDGGELQMSTLPLDLENLLDELRSETDWQPAAPTGTRMGHVHLQVSDLAATEAFYAGVLGFDVVVRGYPGALFVSAGGYHHHLGLNTWHSRGSGPAAPGAVGLRSYDVVLPDAPALEAVLERVRAGGLPVEPAPDVAGAALVRDPSGNGVVLRVG